MARPLYCTTIQTTSTAATSATVGGGLTIGTGTVALVAATGKIPALTSTYFASVDIAGLTGTLASGVQDNITRLGTIATVFTDSATGTHSFGANAAANTSVMLQSGTGFSSSVSFKKVTTVSAQVGSGLIDGSDTKLDLYCVSSDIRFYPGGTNNLVTVFASGGVGIGATPTDPGAGSLRIDAASGGTNTYIFSGTGFLSTTWPASAGVANTIATNGANLSQTISLRRHKDVLGPITSDEARQAVMALTPVHYRSRIAQDDPTTIYPGLIADDVEPIARHLAIYDREGDLASVAYDRVPMYLIPVVQDHERRLAALEAR